MTWKQLQKGFRHLPEDVRLPFRAIRPTYAKRPFPELRTTVMGGLYVGTGHILFRTHIACPSLPKKDGSKHITEHVKKALSASPSPPLGWAPYHSGLLLYLRDDVAVEGRLAAQILTLSGSVNLHSVDTDNVIVAVAHHSGEVLAIVMPRKGDPPWGGVTFPTGNGW